MPSPDQTPGRILAIDYGQKRMGFALCDELRLTTSPLQVWQRTKGQDWAHIEALVHAHEVAEVLVGVPYRLDGSESPSTKRVLAWVSALEQALNVPVRTRDEALTSWAAEERMRSLGFSEQRVKSEVDAYAAACLLEEDLAEAASSAGDPIL